MEAEEEEDGKENGDRYRDTSRGSPLEVIRAGGSAPPPPEENAVLPEFTPERAHLLFWEVYKDFPHHNNASHLDGGVADDAIWKRRWHRLAAKSESQYAKPSGEVGRRFTANLVAKWQGVLGGSWNYKRPLSSPTFFLQRYLVSASQGDPGADHQADGPLGERYPRRHGGVR